MSDRVKELREACDAAWDDLADAYAAYYVDGVYLHAYLDALEAAEAAWREARAALKAAEKEMKND